MIFRLPFNFPWGILGFMLWPFPLAFVAKDAPNTTPDHEHIHIIQLLETLVFGFLPIYLYDYIQGRRAGLTHHQAYLAIRFEKDARKWQGRSLSRPWYDWV